jgi:hypothetical protein
MTKSFKWLDEAKGIYKDRAVKVTKMGHIVEIVNIHYQPDTLQNHVKLDKEHYIITDTEIDTKKLEWHEHIDNGTGEKRLFVVDNDTGELFSVYEYHLNENRSQNIAGLKRTMKKIRDLINNNFIGAKNELFIMLTYRFDGQPMNDVKKASRDFDAFIKRFRRRYPDLEYIAVLEPQANTAWHWHILAKFTKWTEKKHIYIDNNEIMYPMWGHGWTGVKSVRYVDNIGAYLSAYLGNIEINEENKEEIFNSVFKSGRDIVIEEKEVTGEDGKKTTKRFVKGGRMYLYPSGTNIYRYSKGIKKPVSEMMLYSDAKKITGKRPPDYSRTVVIEGNKNDDEEMRIYNTITYEQYNLKRKKKTAE